MFISLCPFNVIMHLEQIPVFKTKVQVYNMFNEVLLITLSSYIFYKLYNYLINIYIYKCGNLCKFIPYTPPNNRIHSIKQYK